MTEASTVPRKGMPSPRLDRAAFERRYRARFIDPAFAPLAAEIDRVVAAAWDAYASSRKSPHTRKASPGPELRPVGRLARRPRRHRRRAGSPRRPGLARAHPSRQRLLPLGATPAPAKSKSWRLVILAREVVEAAGLEAEILDLARVAPEFGRTIHPCKACFSTAPALCHWPCSCYPNHSLGQIHDWMNDIYPMWVAARGILIVTPVNWYQVSSPLKLLMDRLVCADGGNPDPTLTGGKDAARAKAVELAGWGYPRHLAGRVFGVVVHDDVEGAENVRRAIADWLRFMHLEPAGRAAELDRYIGYWEPYATGHAALDADAALQEEVRNAARTLVAAVRASRDGRLVSAGAGLEEPRQK